MVGFFGSKIIFEFLRLQQSIFRAPGLRQSFVRCLLVLRSTVDTVWASVFGGFVFDTISLSPSCLADSSRCLSCQRSKGIGVFWRMTSRKCSLFSACLNGHTNASANGFFLYFTLIPRGGRPRILRSIFLNEIMILHCWM